MLNKVVMLACINALLLQLLVSVPNQQCEAFSVLGSVSSNGGTIKTKSHAVELKPFLAILPTTTTTTATWRRCCSSRLYLSSKKRSFLDQIGSALFQLEQSRVSGSSVKDEKGRTGEPMEWSEQKSFANKFSELVASNEWGYRFKQFVADIVAGNDYDEQGTRDFIEHFVQTHRVAMFSFTTCPFCRRAKDYLETNNIDYTTIELDELDDSTNRGNEIRAVLGKMTRRTSVPSIFLNGKSIGGLNDGSPGLLPLGESGELDRLLA